MQDSAQAEAITSARTGYRQVVMGAASLRIVVRDADPFGALDQ
jgi:hypothetical protein